MRGRGGVVASRKRLAALDNGTALISGTPSDTYTLTASSTGWSVTPSSYTYQWRKNGTAISGQTGSTYVVAFGDVGATLSVSITAIIPGYSNRTVTSASTATVTYGSTIGDTFTRATNTTSLGSTEIGSIVAWTPRRATWGINSINAANMFVGSSGIRQIATIATGQTDGHVKAIIGQNGSVPWNFNIIMRYVDLNNYITIAKTNIAVIAGNTTLISSNHTTPFVDSGPVTTTTVDVYINSGVMTVYMNNSLINTLALPSGTPTGTDVGMGWYGATYAGARYESFFYYAP